MWASWKGKAHLTRAKASATRTLQIVELKHHVWPSFASALQIIYSRLSSTRVASRLMRATSTGLITFLIVLILVWRRLPIADVLREAEANEAWRRSALAGASFSSVGSYGSAGSSSNSLGFSAVRGPFADAGGSSGC